MEGRCTLTDSSCPAPRPSAAPAAFVLTVPIYPKKKPFLNSNERAHWARRRDVTEWYRSEACEAAKTANLQPVDRAHLTAVVSFGDNRRRDVANVYPTVKACVDGLVDAGLLLDDNDRYVVGPDMRRDETGQKSLRLVIQGYAADDPQWEFLRLYYRKAEAA